MDNDKAYKRWEAQVDREVISRVGMSLYDLADQPLRDWYEDGLTPKEAAEETLSTERERWGLL